MNLFHLSLRGTKQFKLFAHQLSEGFTWIFFFCHCEARSNLNCLHISSMRGSQTSNPLRFAGNNCILQPPPFLTFHHFRLLHKISSQWQIKWQINRLSQWQFLILPVSPALVFNPGQPCTGIDRRSPYDLSRHSEIRSNLNWKPPKFLILVPLKQLPNERIFKKYRKMRNSGVQLLKIRMNRELSLTELF